MNVALVAGCCLTGALVGVWLPVDVVPTDDGRSVAEGPRPAPRVVVESRWGQAMIVATAALWGAFAARVGAAAVLPAYLVASAGFVALTVVDLRHQLLPRRIVAPVFAATLALFGVAALATSSGDALLRAVACAAGAYLVFAVLRFASPRSLGGGDVTLAGLLGLTLGWRSVDAVLAGLGAGVVLAALFALAGLATRRLRLDAALSYGPFLIAGALLVLLVAPDGRLLG
jgi:leader peptidase (prepilin peptidase) / N-methyltransferase